MRTIIVAIMLISVIAPGAYAQQHVPMVKLFGHVGASFPTADDDKDLLSTGLMAGGAVGIEFRRSLALMAGVEYNGYGPQNETQLESAGVANFSAGFAYISVGARYRFLSGSEGATKPYLLGGCGLWTGRMNFKGIDPGFDEDLRDNTFGFHFGAGIEFYQTRWGSFYGEAVYIQAVSDNDDSAFIPVRVGLSVDIGSAKTISDEEAYSSVKKSTLGATPDMAIEKQQAALEKYVGRTAWTRVVLEDLTAPEPLPGQPKKGLVPRDTKVEIYSINFSYEGTVTVLNAKRKKIVHGLEIERPMTVAKIDDRMDEIFWFKSPMLRHVDYIRMWGKQTARAVRNHEVFIGMEAEAALESWGVPTTRNVSEIGEKKEEQWIYKDGKKSRYIYVVDGRVTKWEA